MRKTIAMVILATSLICCNQVNQQQKEMSKLEIISKGENTNKIPLKDLSFNYQNSNIKFDHADWERGALYFKKQTLQGYNEQLEIAFDKNSTSYINLNISNPMENKNTTIEINPKKRKISY
jgi:hypothetical protein